MLDEPDNTSGHPIIMESKLIAEELGINTLYKNDNP
jgi:hypothetical protein